MTALIVICGLGTHYAVAQTKLMALSSASGSVRAHALTVRGREIYAQDMGPLSPYRSAGHIAGRFLSKREDSLLKVRKIGRRVFRLSATDSKGERTVRDLLLPLGARESFLVMGGFDLSQDGFSDVAIIGVFTDYLSWQVIENPLQDSMRVAGDFRFGKPQDLLEWCYSPSGALNFVTVAHRRNSRAVRLNIKTFGERDSQSFLTSVPERTDILLPTRVRRPHSLNYCISLYDPDRSKLFIVDNERDVAEYPLPEKRCAGPQKVMQVSESGDLLSLELCQENRYLLMQRKNSAIQPVDLSASEGSLPEGTKEIRRGDITLVQALRETQPGTTRTPEASNDGGVPEPTPVVIPIQTNAPTVSPVNTPTETPTPTATPTASPTVTPTVTPTSDPNWLLYMGVQQSSGAPRVTRVTYNTQTQTATLGSSISLSGFVADSIRVFSALTDGSFISANWSGRQTVTFNAAGVTSTGPLLSTGGSPAEISGIHGLCVLPDNTIIAGGYTGVAGNPVQQFSANGAYLRTVYTTTINAFTDCVAVSSNEIFIIDYDANNDSDGDVIKLTLSGGVWSIVARWDQSSAGLGAGSSIYSLVLGSDGHLYAPAQHGAGSRNRKMIRCLNRDLSLCAPFGDDIYSTGALLQGAVEIPGTDTILLAHETQMYRFNMLSGSVTPILSLSGQGISQVRHLRRNRAN